MDSHLQDDNIQKALNVLNELRKDGKISPEV